MSDLRVALVAEGPTDAIILEAALKALIPQPFVLTRLQPEPTRPQFGNGWVGVLRWCHDFASRGSSQLENDPTLPGFDLFILHLDADVAECAYTDEGPAIAQLAQERGYPPLPCSIPCPPPDSSANEMRRRLLAWTGLSMPGPKTVLCVPSKATDAWLTAAIFSNNHRLLSQLECNLNLEAQLAALPKTERIKKSTTVYRNHERQVTDKWSIVRNRCSLAEKFSAEVLAATAPPYGTPPAP